VQYIHVIPCLVYYSLLKSIDLTNCEKAFKYLATSCQFHGVTTCLHMCLYLRLHLQEEIYAMPVNATIPCILNKFTIATFDNFHSIVPIVHTTDQTCRQYIPNYCLIIRASNSGTFLKRGLFDDIRITNGFTGRSQPNDFTCYGFCHCIYFFLLENPYKHSGAEFCTKNKTWNIREIRERDGRC